MSVATVQVVADTNIVIWYFLEPDKLTAAAREALETETTAGRPVGVSAWALVEIGYAAEKRSNPLTAEDRSAILAELTAPDSPFDVVAVDAEIAVRVADVPREANAAPGDRVLVATAEVLGARLVSADRMLPEMTTTTVMGSPAPQASKPSATPADATGSGRNP